MPVTEQLSKLAYNWHFHAKSCIIIRKQVTKKDVKSIKPNFESPILTK